MIDNFYHGFLNRVYGSDDYTQLEINSKLIQKMDEVIDECNKAFEIMNWIKEEIKSRGYDKISLWVLEENNRARSFYEKMGFVTDGEIKPSGLADTQEARYVCKFLN